MLDCRQAVFFFTSNLRSAAILREVTEQDAFEDASQIDNTCRSRLVDSGIQPELAGRIGCFLVFRPLSQSTQAEVITLSIVDVGREYGVDVARIEPSVITSILANSLSCDFGARPARNAIEDALGPVFAETRSSGNQSVGLAGPPYACLPLGKTYDRCNSQSSRQLLSRCCARPSDIDCIRHDTRRQKGCEVGDQHGNLSD